MYYAKFLKGVIFLMKTVIFILSLVLAVHWGSDSSLALEVPENYSDSISAVDFFPSGAKFTFTVEPQNNDGTFSLVIPGSFNAESIRPLNPENLYGDIHTSVHPRTKWTPSQLEPLRLQIEAQSKTVSSLNSKKAALEQTLSLLNDSEPDKSKPEELLTYIMKAQALRQETEDELSSLKVILTEEQEKLKMLNSEMQGKSPRGSTNFILVTGKANGTMYIEAFTNAASWKPRYALNLSSETGNIEASMFIRASQKTGLDYNGKMTLHTKTPDERVTAPELNPLRVSIKPKAEVLARGSGVRLMKTNRMYESARAAAPMEMLKADEDTALEDFDEAPAVPEVKETLADRTLEIKGELPGDGTDRDFEITAGKMILAGKLELTLIPEQRNNAWIVASMDEGNEHLIPGEAELMVDGHSSGKIYLDEYGKNQNQKRIPFGYAEQITVKKEALIEKTGVSWFSGVFTSGYRLEITNGTKFEQVIKVRDRLPIPTDEKIKLDVKRIDPKEKERDKENRLTWEITVPSGATVPIIVDYTLSYPSGEELLYR